MVYIQRNGKLLSNDGKNKIKTKLYVNINMILQIKKMIQKNSRILHFNMNNKKKNRRKKGNTHPIDTQSLTRNQPTSPSLLPSFVPSFLPSSTHSHTTN